MVVRIWGRGWLEVWVFFVGSVKVFMLVKVQSRGRKIYLENRLLKVVLVYRWRSIQLCRIPKLGYRHTHGNLC